MQLPIDFIRSILTAASLSHQFSVSSTDSDGTRWTACRSIAASPSIIVSMTGDKYARAYPDIGAFVRTYMSRIFGELQDGPKLGERAMQGPGVAELLADAKANAAAARAMMEASTAMREAAQAPEIMAELEREATQMRARMERLERENAELHNALESTTHNGAMRTVVQLLRTAASWADMQAQRDELHKELGETDHVAALEGIKSLRMRADMLSELHAVVQMQNSAASPVLGVPSDLAKFYDAPTWPQLVKAQAKHIESLQKRVQYGAGGQVEYGK